MRNITGQAVVGDDLYGRDYELARIWERLDQGEHLLMLAPRRVGKTSLMLELHRAPHENWDVVYVDVQSGDSAADCVAATLSALAARPEFRSRFEAILFSKAVQDVLGRLSATVDTGVLRVELKSAIGREWSHAADQLPGAAHQAAGFWPQSAGHHRRAADSRFANAAHGRGGTRCGAAVGLVPTIASSAGVA